MKIKQRLILLFIVILCLPSLASAQLVNTVVSLTGNIFDAVTKEPVSCYILVTDENNKRINFTRSNAFENGYYFITGLKPGKKYYVNITKKKYFREKFEINIANTVKYVEMSRDFLIKPNEVGAQIPLPVPPFELNKNKLRFGAEELLTDFKSTLLNNPKVKFEIVSYPDNNLNKSENKKLTEERCKSLKDFFIKNGIDASRITVKASSTTDPKNPPPTKKRAKGKRYIGTTYIVVKSL